MCPPVPFCQCSVAQGRLLELAQSSRLRWCLPSALGSRHIPWDGGSSSAHPALPTRSWSCREAAPGAGESPHPAGTWGFLSSWNLQLQLPGEGNAWQGWPGMAGDSPGWGEGAPTAASGKGFGAQGGHEGLGGAAQGEGTALGRKCLAELKLLVKDPEFWAELGQDPGGNIGLERERSSPASWGLVSPLGATCPSRGGALCPQGRFLAPGIPPGCCQTWQPEGNSLERGVAWIGKRNTASPGLLKTREEQIKARGEVSCKF